MVVLVLIAVSVGGYMLLDGTRNLLTGTYFGESLGPWSGVVRAVGFEPERFGIVFVALGAAWLIALVALLTSQSWSKPAAAGVAVLTLWYLPVGTALSIVYLFVVLTTRPGLASGSNH